MKKSCKKLECVEVKVQVGEEGHPDVQRTNSQLELMPYSLSHWGMDK